MANAWQYVKGSNLYPPLFRIRDIFTALVIVLLLTPIIPVKFCVLNLPADSEEDFYIINYSPSKNEVLLVGDKSGFYSDSIEQERFVRLLGNDPFSTVSVNLYWRDDATNFIVRGTITIDEYWDRRDPVDISEATLYTIYCTDWDVFGRIKTSNPFPKLYLTIYDYEWVDRVSYEMFHYFVGNTM